MNMTKFSSAAALVMLMSTGTAMAAGMADCAGSDISVPGASCIGFLSGNLNGNKPSLTDINLNLAVWGVHLTQPVASTSMLSGLSGDNVINFTQQLYGDTIVGIHYGNVMDAQGKESNNVTAFYRFNAGNGAGLDSFTTRFDSLSNATLYSTGTAPLTAVPEPGTYAMMFAGLGLMGLVARRRMQK
ncbi:MAG TPA: PEP-CTERM sorting domain-containing protein [Duganella sp.]|uniref:PEP-CTERM sorting domain-containing protein n=1 Tax=Duganella sp. TaxID=1904440 RepID=UPI002ED302E1